MENLPAIIGALSGLITTCFAGYIAIRQLPQIHKLTNRNFSEQKAKIDELEERLRGANVIHSEEQQGRIDKLEEKLDR